MLRRITRLGALCLVAAASLASSGFERRQAPDRQEVRAKVGQLFMLAFSGQDKERILPLIRDRGVGALYLSNENLTEPAATARLLNSLQEAALGGIAKLPLLTACDQEGAWAVMVPFSASGPGNMALGGADPKYTEEMYSVFGRELAAVGVFADLAPDADVNSNPRNPIIGTRSFGEDAARVAAHVEAAVRGLHRHDVVATAKHFPGHGNTGSDTHSGLARVERDRAAIDSVDLRPFRAAVKAGVDMVMTAHIVYTALDPDHPSTLSHRILTDYLRKELGFDGVIITDSFNMDAIRKNFSSGDAAVAAINAGADMIMLAEERYGDDVGDYIRSQTALLDRVEDAVMRGEISMQRLDEAYGHVKALKEKYRIAQRIPVNPEAAARIVGSKEDLAVELRAAKAAANVVYDRSGVLPLKAGSTIYVMRLSTQDVAGMIRGMRGIGPNYAGGYDELVAALRSFRYHVREITVRDGVPADGIIVAVAENYPLPGKSLDLEAQRRRLAQVQSAFRGKVVVVGLSAPYDALLVKPDAYVSAVGSNRSNAQAAAAVLAGEVKPTSKLSVTPLQP